MDDDDYWEGDSPRDRRNRMAALERDNEPELEHPEDDDELPN